MEIVVFSFLCLVYMALGLISITNLSFKDLGLILFIILTVLLPITKFTAEFHTNWQISAYYFFFIAPCITIFLRIINNRASLLFTVSFILLMSMLLLYCIHYYFCVDEVRKSTDILKDAKPFILILLAIIFMDSYKKRLREILTQPFSDRLLFVNLVICTVLFFIMYRFNLHLKLTSDPYYKFEELRLETLGCYYGIFYFLHLLFNNIRIKWFHFIICLVPLLYTGNRTLIFSVFIIITIFFLTKLSPKKLLLFIFSSFAGVVGLLYLILSADKNSPLFRFQKLFNIDYINYALLNRFSPFIKGLKEYAPIDFVTGKGLGYTFYIPWFHYRESLDMNNIYIDNLYLTLYAKFGILFIVLYGVMYYYLRTYLNKMTANLYFIFILVLSITNAFVYQYNFLWIFLLMVFPFHIIQNIKSEKQIKRVD